MTKPSVTLYGAARCHKTQHYQQFFVQRDVPYIFRDVEEDPSAAQELRHLYPSGALHFPTITIGSKRLRNPKDKDLHKWLHRLGNLAP